jgi:hypothetical protein
MHPVTRFLNYLKHKDFSMVLAREHLSDRELTEWYADWMYEAMETDEIRNRAYEEAIRDSVAGKVVLELGTGRKALWAVCCARAGAKRVYAVEANRRAFESSVRFVRSKKFDNIHLIHGFSDKISLPERCEILVHDLVGDIGSSEGMIPFIEDAKRRLLTPDAVHIPQRCTTHVFLAEDPKLRPAEWAFSYLMRGLRPFERLTFARFFGFRYAAALSEPYAFEDFVLRQTPDLCPDRRLAMEIKRDGLLRGVCFFIRLYLDGTRVVDTLACQTSWCTPYVRIKTPVAVRKGDVVEMAIQSDLSGNPSYSIVLTHRVDGAVKEIGGYAWSGD